MPRQRKGRRWQCQLGLDGQPARYTLQARRGRSWHDVAQVDLMPDNPPREALAGVRTGAAGAARADGPGGPTSSDTSREGAGGVAVKTSTAQLCVTLARYFDAAARECADGSACSWLRRMAAQLSDPNRSTFLPAVLLVQRATMHAAGVQLDQLDVESIEIDLRDVAAWVLLLTDWAGESIGHDGINEIAGLAALLQTHDEHQTALMRWASSQVYGAETHE